MENIYLDDIDLSKLHTINSSGNKESTLFHNYKTIYKIFNDLHDVERERKQKKVELLGNGNSLPITVMPKEELFYAFFNNRFEGYGMDYINKSKTLYKKFIKMKMKDTKLLFSILNDVSCAIMEIHSDPRNIVIGDLHVQNIIVDKDLNPYIIDIDSCKIDGIPNDTIPMTLKNYLLNRHLYKSLAETKINPNTDRLCFLIMTLGIIFKTNIDRISMYEYDEKSEKIETLRDMRELVLEIKQSSDIPKVPYMHELIKDSDIKKKRRI